jgi:predicted enzyme related to lactoylglutathione lyase
MEKAMKYIPHHVLLWVSDMDRAIHFYTKTLSIALQFQSPTFSIVGGKKFWISLHLGTQTAEQRKRHNKESPIVNLKPDDVDKAFQQMREKGVSFYAEPYWAAPNVRVAEFYDTEGNRLALSSAD